MLDIDPAWPTALLDFPATSTPANATHPTARRRMHFGQAKQWLVAHDAQQVPALLREAHRLSKQGHWCLGWVSYEAAPAFDPHLPVKATAPGHVYAAWAVFDATQAHADWPAPAASDADFAWRLDDWLSDLSAPAQARAMQTIQDLIRQGDVYQINLTAQLKAELHAGSAAPSSATLHGLFRALHRSQPGGFSMLLDARAATRSPGTLMSVSPELFFEWDGHRIETRPMKGTAARHTDNATDQAAAQYLRDSAKERAENVMIVDLLRNDLSRIATTGSVQVNSLFDVHALPTVWQMTSSISAQTLPGIDLADVFAALFPCGSITGAPKQRAMHHIARLETSPRGVYCGAVGVLEPGGHATFNVPIRTVCVNTPPPNAPWIAHCGIGSGITLDANIAAEQDEWKHKQVFLHRAQQSFELLTSMRLEDGRVLQQAAHLARLEASAKHFGFTGDAASHTACWPDWSNRILDAIKQIEQQHPQGVFKARLLLSSTGVVHTQVQILQGAAVGHLPSHAAPQATRGEHLARIGLASQAMPPANDFIFHKTTLRSAYQPFAPAEGLLDTLLFNAQGEVTEFTIGNVAVCLDWQWFTPPVRCGLLPGVMRAHALQQGWLHERIILVDELTHAQGLALMNSVRGWVAVELASL